MPMSETRLLTGPVEIVGAGLLGTSIALALRGAGVEVLLTDTSSKHLRTASGLGAGRPTAEGDRPQLVVVAVPPDLLGTAIAGALARTRTIEGAVVTDVGSVKTAPLAALSGNPEARRYVGGHPMAGSERSGPLAATAALFDGRPWAITPHPGVEPAAVELVEELARLCGAVAVRLSPAEHDRAVARISHVPHLLAALVAGRLADAPADHLALSGQGVRDVTRVAAGSPSLYGQIVSGNAAAVGELLVEVRADLEKLIGAVANGDRDGLEILLARGVAGTRAIPGKHGGPARPTRSVFVSVPDNPGELARLFADAGESGVNIEDVHIDHDPGRPVGLVELVVDNSRAEHLLGSLESRGWVTHR
jgi:prephenate dehydrogenase